MANLNSLSNARKMLEDLKREHRFKKRNAAVEREANVQYQLGKCRGELELSLTELDQTIRTQSRNIVHNSVTHAADKFNMGRTELNTIQEQMLWDAAIAYMLVKDALVALKTVSSQDSISSAYEMLDAAASQLSGKKQHKFFKMPQVRAAVGRGHYSFITSEEALNEKEERLDQFFGTLRMTGDIEACLQNAKNPIDVDAERKYLSGTGKMPTGGLADDYKERLHQLRDTKEDESELYDPNMAKDIYPGAPVKQNAAPVEQTAPATQEASAAQENPVERMDSVEDLKKQVQNLSE